MVFFIVILITIGYLSALIKVSNTNYFPFNFQNIKSKIIAEVEEIEIRGNEKKLLIKNIKTIPDINILNLKKAKIVVRTKLDALKKNDFIIANVSLMPPPEPILPESFNYSRHAFFRDINAVGYAIGDIKIIIKDDLKNSSLIEKIKNLVFKSFYLNMENKYAAIASALFLGDSKKIDTQTYEEIRISGIAHLLAISGMHIGLVTALIFFLSNLALSKIYNPDVIINNKKISALIAVCFSLFYLLLANSPISAQRAFIMAALVLVGIFIDRKITPLRALGFTAVVILLVTPDALLSASLQMSFSACIGLIYGFKLLAKTSIVDFDLRTTFILKLKTYFLSIILASIFATVATSMFVMFHFKNLSTYSVLTNLLAIPITEFIIMPFGILGIILVPLKLEWIGYYPMELGIKLLLKIAKSVTSFPNAVIKVSNVKDICLAAYIFGFISLMIFKGKWKYVSFIFFSISFYKFFTYRLPDIVISKNAKMVAIKDFSDSKLYLIAGFRERYAKKIWMQELDLKETNKNYLKTICKEGLCNISMGMYNVSIVFQKQENITYCYNKNSIFINLTDIQNTCETSLISINKKNLKNNGTYMIWLDEGKKIHIKNSQDYKFGKPWESKF